MVLDFVKGNELLEDKGPYAEKDAKILLRQILKSIEFTNYQEIGDKDIIFKAPESFTNNYTPVKANVWSAGIVFYMMLTGKQPFFDEDLDQIAYKITNEQPDFETDL